MFKNVLSIHLSEKILGETWTSLNVGNVKSDQMMLMIKPAIFYLVIDLLTDHLSIGIISYYDPL